MLRWNFMGTGRCVLHAVSVLFAAMLWSAGAGAAPILNGSFEQGPATGSFITLPGGSASIPGWTVLGTSIDYVTGSVWDASDGDVSLDLNGSGTGGVVQLMTTVPGTTYALTFDLAGNPSGPDGIYQVQVSIGGATQVFGFDTTGQTAQDMGWESFQVQFTADGVSTTLGFQSLESGSYGPALDNVSVAELVAVPEPSTALLLTGSLAGLGWARRRNQS